MNADKPALYPCGEAVPSQGKTQGIEPGRSGPRPLTGGRRGTALVPLLAAREEAIDDTMEELFGDTLRPGRASRATDAEGWSSGRAAADLATLHNRDQVAE